MAEQKHYDEVYISPHFDDLHLSCAKLMADSQERAHTAGKSVLALTVFAGTPEPPQVTPWDTRAGLIDSTDSLKTRTQENNDAFKDTPFTIENLSFIDDQYTKAPLPPEEFEQLKQQLLGRMSVGTTVYAPAGIARFHRGPNPDHVTVRKAVQEIVSENPDLQLTVNFYGDLPYIYPRMQFKNWPNRFLQRIWLNLEARRALGKGMEVVPIRLNEQMQQKKNTALDYFSSQIGLMRQKYNGAFYNSAFAWEVLFRAKPARHQAAR